MKYNQLEHTMISINSHDESQCEAVTCPMHKRTDHHMRGFKQFFLHGWDIVVRVCPHGVKHPDPDDMYAMSSEYAENHNCDACCIRFATEEEYNAGNN
jgi:hypothetical protein